MHEITALPFAPSDRVCFFAGPRRAQNNLLALGIAQGLLACLLLLGLAGDWKFSCTPFASERDEVSPSENIYPSLWRGETTTAKHGPCCHSIPSFWLDPSLKGPWNRVPSRMAAGDHEYSSIVFAMTQFLSLSPVRAIQPGSPAAETR